MSDSQPAQGSRIKIRLKKYTAPIQVPPDCQEVNTIELVLQKPAKSTGADKYYYQEGDIFMYIPQELSRGPKGASERLQVTITKK